MKKGKWKKESVTLGTFILSLLIGISFYVNQNNIQVKAMTERPETVLNGLAITGSQKTVAYSDKGKKATVTFDFQTTDPYYDGFYGGGYYIQWDESRMDISDNGVTQRDSTVNYDHTLFTCNGMPATKGTVLVGCAQAIPSQTNQLSVTFENIFKDGDESPIEVNIIPRNDDRLFAGVKGTNGNDYVYISNPVIKKAKLTLEKPSYLLSGKDEFIKGTKNNDYQTTIPGDVIWSIKNMTSLSTKIDEQGNVIVGIDETAKTIEIIATSTTDKNIETRKQVSLKDKTYTIKSIQLPVDKTTLYEGVLEDELNKQLGTINKIETIIETNDNKEYTLSIDVKSYFYDQKCLNEQKKLIVGLYDVIYTLDLPYIEIDENNELTNTKTINTNIKGDNKTLLRLEVLKNQETYNPKDEPKNDPSTKQEEEVSQDNQIKKTKIVVTDDKGNAEIWFLYLSVSVISMIRLMKMRKVAK